MKLVAKDYRNPLSLTLTTIPKAQTPKKTISPAPSKTTKVTKAKLKISPPSPIIQNPTPEKSKTPSPSRNIKTTYASSSQQEDTP